MKRLVLLLALLAGCEKPFQSLQSPQDEGFRRAVVVFQMAAERNDYKALGYAWMELQVQIRMHPEKDSLRLINTYDAWLDETFALRRKAGKGSHAAALTGPVVRECRELLN